MCSKITLLPLLRYVSMPRGRKGLKFRRASGSRAACKKSRCVTSPREGSKHEPASANFSNLVRANHTTLLLPLAPYLMPCAVGTYRIQKPLQQFVVAMTCAYPNIFYDIYPERTRINHSWKWPLSTGKSCNALTR